MMQGAEAKTVTKRLLLATANAGKIVEISTQLKACGIDVVGLPQDYESPVEDGGTCQANVQIKADAARRDPRFRGMMILADDSGLFVEGHPDLLGVNTSEFIKDHPGKDTKDYSQAFAALHKLVGEKPKRAYYYAILRLIDAQGQVHVFEGRMEGTVRFDQPSGSHGFAYDPVFYPDVLNDDGKPLVSIANLSQAEKSKISHRGQAMAKLVAFLDDVKN